MAVELSGILPGVAGWAQAVGTQHPVDGTALQVQQVSIDQAAGGMIR